LRFGNGGLEWLADSALLAKGAQSLKKFLVCSTALTHIFVAVPAIAGEEVIYDPATPSWAKQADLAPALAVKQTLVLLDRQVRLEDGTSHAYSDIAYRIENPEALTQLGTLKLSWLPDKGDLKVHRLAIVRDGQTIDLLAQGTRYDVLRREQELEKRSLDGQLTATLSVPGLKVGDVLRFTQTITNRDQALNGEVQSTEGLRAEPTKMGFGRVIVSWPQDEEMRWKVHRISGAVEPVTEGGYRTIAINLPVAKPDELPDDAPSRFTIPPLLQVASFTSWQDVSQVMAPHFATAGTIAPGSAIAGEVERIKAAASTDLERTALALRLVQDEVSYLLNGLNGGNYLPQSPEQTWQLRYGDCKAKSMLLLAMLREMGIESEAVLVQSQSGNMVVNLLPAPSAFDHMIVRAVIDGQEYWLDGTTAGTRLDTLDEVPAFHYALPLREGGADLMPMAQRWPTLVDREARVTLDYSAGLDLPVLYDAEVSARGVMGARLRPQVDEKDAKSLRDYAMQYLENIIGENIVSSVTVTYDEGSGLATLRAQGLMDSGWNWERGKGSLALDLPSTGFDFAPDRARKAWRDIPVQVGGPVGYLEELTLILPEGQQPYEIKGLGDVDETIAGVRIKRSVTRDGNRIVVRDDSRKIPIEIAVADLGAERAKAARFKGGDPIVRAPADVTRYWQFTDGDKPKRVAQHEAMYAAIVANDPSEAWRWSLRGSLRQYHGDLAGALADFSRALDIEPTVERYLERAGTYQQLGKTREALADAREAYDLDASSQHAIYLAQLLGEAGQLKEAIDLLEPLDLSGDDRVSNAMVRSELLGEAGRLEEGWALLEDLALERPGDGEVLNAQCWYMGLWKYRLDSAGAICDEAVEVQSYSANVLDSRAMVHFRLGNTDQALRDLDAALASEPALGASLFLRGVIRNGLADKTGAQDLAHARRLFRNVDRQYARYGIKP
jgi:tetratricopeptide (TPR) repeat protein